MFAVFTRRQSQLTALIFQSLPPGETSLLTPTDFSERPPFSLAISPTGAAVALLDQPGTQPISGGLVLSFPAFDPPVDLDNPDYYTASWQSAFLAVLEALLPNLAPRASAADWIASFERSYARRPALASQLDVPFPASRLIEGEYLPGENELVYSLERRAILPAVPGAALEGFLEVFPNANPAQLHSAVVLQRQCWLTRYTPDGLQPIYQGPIEDTQPAPLQPLLARAAAEWGLAHLVFLFDGQNPSLLQVRFEVEPALHPAHHPSFARAVAAYAAAHV